MDIDTVKAVIQKQQTSQLEYYTGKKTSTTKHNTQFANLLEQTEQKVWNPQWVNSLDEEDSKFVRSYLGANGISYVQQYGESEAVAVIGAIGSAAGYSPLKVGTSPTSFDSLIDNAAQKYGVSADLIRAIIKTESNFRPDAVSTAGAKGLMQLMDGTARGLGVANSLDPAQNIDGGSKYIAMLLKKYNGNIDVALAAYNGGPGRIDRLGISDQQSLADNFSKLPKETRSYIGKVRAAMA